MIELYEHQKDALERLRTGSILCGGVGSGKSITSIAYFFTKVCGGDPFSEEFIFPTKPRDLYIITIAKKRDEHEWEGELSNFCLSTNPNISICGIKVVIDSWNNIKKYLEVKNAFFIFDEQKVSGYGAWSKSFIKISKNNDWILLSATPGDTWSDYIPVFIANGFYRNKTDFERQHVVWQRYTKYPKIERYVNVYSLIRYKTKILIKMDSVVKKPFEVRTITVPYVKESYKHILKERWNPFTNKPIRNASELCQVLRRSIQNPAFRLEEIVKLFDEYKRLIIFYNYDYELEVLKSLTSYPIYEYNGHKHESIPDSDEWIYLVHYNSGAEAWNCIKTNIVVFYSPNYSYKIMKQAAGRIDRLNNPYEKLYYYILRTYSGVDLRIIEALRGKKTFNENKYEEILNS